jgi:hypothetical protein
MKNVTIYAPQIGANEIYELYEELDGFVREHFDALYAGAVRLQVNIPEDCYAPRRIEHENVRLHAKEGLKRIGGWHYHKSHPDALKEEHLLLAIAAVNQLLQEAAKEIKCSFRLEIKSK